MEDMQFIVSLRRVLKYIAKYAAKGETRSPGLKAVYRRIMKCLNLDANVLKFVQKLINSVGERDYSAQETCYLLVQLPMFRASRDFVILSLDGSRQVDDWAEEGNDVATLHAQRQVQRSNVTYVPYMGILEARP